jgi:2'-5' RNA ligase
MKTSNITTEMMTLPGYRMCEYMLVVQPHEELWQKIMQLKKDFAATYDAPSAEWGKPQITVARFSQLQLMEERIINRLKTIAMAMPAFKIELKDFGSFPSHTLYINVESKTPLQLLVKHTMAIRKELAPIQQQKFYRPVHCKKHVAVAQVRRREVVQAN